MEFCSFWESVLMFKIYLTLHIIIESLPPWPSNTLQTLPSPKKPLVVFLGRLSHLRVCSHYLISRLLRTFWCSRRASPPPPPPRFQDDKCCNAASAFLQWEWMPLFHYENWLLEKGSRRVLCRWSLDFNPGRISNEKTTLPPLSLPNTRCLIPCYKLRRRQSRFLD